MSKLLSSKIILCLLFLMGGLLIGAVVHFMSSARTCYEAGGCWDERAQECRYGHDEKTLHLCKRR